ncbi:MAG: hypothetical protein ACLQQ4_16980 [Bacteroidia bacterium]
MKKPFVLLLCIAFFSQVRAQSFELGGRYLAVSNWFFNSNVSNSGGTTSSVAEDYSATYSSSYGLHIAYNFNEHTGLETNILFASLSQDYNGNFPAQSGVLPVPVDGQTVIYSANETYKSSTTITALQIPIFFRFLSGNGAYAEIGPEYDVLSDATYNASYLSGPVDVKSYYPSGYIAGVLAFGNNVRITHSFFFNINLRISYDFTDLKGVDALGQNLSDNILYQQSSGPFYGSYSATHQFSVAFGVGLFYRFGHDF